MAASKSTRTTKSKAAALKSLPAKQKAARFDNFIDEFFVRTEEDQLAAKKAEEERARLEGLYDARRLSEIHDKLYEAKGLCKALYLAQHAEECEDGPDDLAVTGMADVSLIVHRILSDVQEKLDSFEADIGNPRSPKDAAAQEAAHGA